MSSRRDDLSRTIVLVRHAESTANRDSTLTGRIDPELTKRGRLQARRAARYIGGKLGQIDLLYTSPLRRSRHTAQFIASRLNIALVEDELLIETNFGTWEGMGREHLAIQPEWEHYLEDPFHFRFPGGESPQQVRERVNRFLNSLLRRDDWRSAVIVTHYTPLAFFVLQVLGIASGSRAPFAVDNASITVVKLNGTYRYIELLNCVP
jgi:probable phosphoglycerate mutase